MQTNNTFAAIFFTRKSRGHSKKLSIYTRITVNGKRAEISLKRSVSVYNWDCSKCRAWGASQNIRILNKYLDHVYGQLLDYHKKLFDNNLQK